MLALYNLFAADIARDPVEDDTANYLGIAVHSPFKRISSQEVDEGNSYHAVPLSLPSIDPVNARTQISAFIKDFGIKVYEDPYFKSTESEHFSGKAVLTAEKEKARKASLEKRQLKFPPSEPRWMLIHNSFG